MEISPSCEKSLKKKKDVTPSRNIGDSVVLLEGHGTLQRFIHKTRRWRTKTPDGSVQHFTEKQLSFFESCENYTDNILNEQISQTKTSLTLQEDFRIQFEDELSKSRIHGRLSLSLQPSPEKVKRKLRRHVGQQVPLLNGYGILQQFTFNIQSWTVITSDERFEHWTNSQLDFFEIQHTSTYP